MNFRTILREEIKKRVEKNPSYSLRAFARDLGILPNRLISVLNGKYGFSPAAAQKIAETLGFDPEKTALFVDLVRMEHARSRKDRDEARKRFVKDEAPVKELVSTFLSKLSNRPLEEVTREELASLLGIEGDRLSQYYEALIKMEVLNRPSSS